ncbi:hypothetical protein DRP04_13065 [Archaeoglobales archaeon]|nr:MAG: hypothetical protein DRP04_13065 [Archaeoglobales archaeon]
MREGFESFEEHIEEYETVIEAINNLIERRRRMAENNPIFKEVIDFYKKFIKPLHSPKYYISEVWKFFQKLRPFAYRKAVVRVQGGALRNWNYDALLVGRDIRIGYYYSLCEDHKRGHSLDMSDFVEVVSKHYEKIVPYLRRPIRETFEELAKLVGELELSLTIVQGCEGYSFYEEHSDSTFEIIPCKELSISISKEDDPEIIAISYINGRTRYAYVTWSSNLFALYKPIYRAYKKFYNEWSKIQKKNDEILEKMRKILGEYVLVNNL